MRRLFARAGVDYVQWRALMRAYYLIDVGPLLGAHGSKETLLAVARLLLAILFYAFLGGGVAVLVLAARDPLVGAVAMTATTMWLTAMSVLFQSSSLILPDDYALLGFQPSRRAPTWRSVPARSSRRRSRPPRSPAGCRCWR